MQRALLLVGLLVAGGCLGTPAPDRHDGTPAAPKPWFRFSSPLPVPAGTDGIGSEPSLLVAHDGTFYVVGVLGSATARGDGLWKSLDRGQTWAYLGKPDYPFGGGDADLDEDAAGTLYLPGQWRGAVPPAQSPVQPYVTTGESMAVSTDHGATWTQFPVASFAPVVDRQWTATYQTGNAWLAFNQAQLGLVVTRTTDSGRTWTPLHVVPGTQDPGDGLLVAGGPNGIPGDWIVDPDGTLYLPYAPGIGGGSHDHRVFISHNGGQTFQSVTVRTVPAGEQPSAVFGSLARADDGTLFYAWSESVRQGADGMRVFLSRSTDHAEHWSAPIPVTNETTTAVFPWIVAGDAQHVAVSYYATQHAAHDGFRSDDAPAGTEWRPYASLSRDADAAVPTFVAAPLADHATHLGPLCTGGTGCDSAYRQLGDFFETAMTPDAHVVTVWLDDTGPSRTQWVSLQVDGDLR